MKSKLLILFGLYLIGFTAASGNAAVIGINTLDSQSPTDTYNAGTGYTPPQDAYDVDSSAAVGPTGYNGYTPSGGVAADLNDATFRVPLTFNASGLAGSDGNRTYVIWESGGSGKGSVVFYNPGDTNSGSPAAPTLTFHYRESGALNFILNVSLAGQLDQELDVVWSFDFDDAGDTEDSNTIRVFIDGEESGALAHTGTDWSGGDSAGYGSLSGTAPVGGTSPDFAGSSVGSINNTIGLRYYNDIAVVPVIPEPASLTLVGVGVGLISLRSRSRN